MKFNYQQLSALRAGQLYIPRSDDLDRSSWNHCFRIDEVCPSSIPESSAEVYATVVGAKHDLSTLGKKSIFLAETIENYLLVEPLTLMKSIPHWLQCNQCGEACLFSKYVLPNTRQGTYVLCANCELKDCNNSSHSARVRLDTLPQLEAGQMWLSGTRCYRLDVVYNILGSSLQGFLATTVGSKNTDLLGQRYSTDVEIFTAFGYQLAEPEFVRDSGLSLLKCAKCQQVLLQAQLKDFYTASSLVCWKCELV